MSVDGKLVDSGGQGKGGFLLHELGAWCCHWVQVQVVGKQGEVVAEEVSFSVV